MNTAIVNRECTYSIGSDSYPCTIIEVSKSGHRVVVQFDKFRGSKYGNHDWYGMQNWVIERNPNGRTEVFTRREGGKYRPRGSSSSGILHLGIWKAKQDPSF